QQYFDDPTVEELWINEPSRAAKHLFERTGQTCERRDPRRHGSPPCCHDTEILVPMPVTIHERLDDLRGTALDEQDKGD
ncbi:MAG: hypothetical protein L0H79_20100, partial [Intrasporangium sp.]|uniref:hypothetical protein n=1 Tax=Intrasporangium sp. TaxID=1925024 RepID=UPI002648E849